MRCRRLSCKRKENRKRKFGAVGRPFKMDLKDRFVMFLVYYRLYIIYALAGFLFDLDQKSSNFCRGIQKIEKGSGKTMCTNSTKDIPNNKEAENSSRGS